MDLNSAKLFAHVAAKGSFSAAATSLGIPVATVSRRVADLEAKLNVRLLERSTRKLRLTEAGTTLFGFVSRGVEEMEAGLLALSKQETELRGRLRLSMPPSFEPMWALIDAFQKQYGNIDIELIISERRLEFIEDGIDIALRVGSIESPLSVARKLTQYSHKLVATPDFLSRHTIETPKDICQIKCAAWSKQHAPVIWQLGDERLTISPFMRANDYTHMSYLVRQGHCISELPPFFCQNDIDQGVLVEVLPEHPMPQQHVHLLYPSRKNISRISRVFIDYCVANFALCPAS